MFLVEDVHVDRSICAWTERHGCKGKKIAVVSDLGIPPGTPRQKTVWLKLVPRRDKAYMLNSDNKFPSEQACCPRRLFLFRRCHLLKQASEGCWRAPISTNLLDTKPMTHYYVGMFSWFHFQKHPSVQTLERLISAEILDDDTWRYFNKCL